MYPLSKRYGMKTNNCVRKCGLKPHERWRGATLSRLGLRKVRRLVLTNLTPHGKAISVKKVKNFLRKGAKSRNGAL